MSVIKPRLQGSLLFEFEEARTHVLQEIIHQLAYCGEKAVQIARTDPTGFNDRTGNLRSSIGYGVFLNGKQVVGSRFPSVGQSSDGHKDGGELLQEVGSNTHHIALVVVAGMKYASYVENIAGHHVLAPARLKTEANVRQALKGLIKGI